MSIFEDVDNSNSFDQIEHSIIDFWRQDSTFQKSLENTKGNEEFKFYDGPPFATGMPHYGHILSGALKDIIPRYKTMTGYHVPRKFGWDCHGVPIEGIVEKELNVKNKKQIENEIGVYNFNEHCRNNVFLYANERRRVVERMGRWVDMDDDYKTMDKDFMESVWWVFKELYNKGLVYESYRVVPYSIGMETPLSNFEVNQGYEEIQDKAVTVKFQKKDEDNTFFLAWTTTPWTLAGNLALAVGENIEYKKIYDNKYGENYILATDTIGNYYKSDEEYTVLNTFMGKDIVGLEYEPIFKDFKQQVGNLPKGMEVNKNSFKVVFGHHVTTESGTGIVHIAPCFGEDDFKVGKENNIGFICHIDDYGYTENLLENNGVYVFDFNEDVIQQMKKTGTVVKIETIVHNYPHCYRTDIPLIYKAISAWYVNVEGIKQRLIENNSNINWVPENLKYGRFGKRLEGCKDWNISRNRYWGATIPVRQDEDKEENIVVGSVQELYELNKEFGQIKYEDGRYFYTDSGIEIDLHKHFVDYIYVKSPNTGKTLKRVSEVLDCWFESGSMPYASVHYPFENKENFVFPANFIAEGIDQTRGWFYTLLVLGTALFDSHPFESVVVNGTVLAEDGKKMSKRLKNYPEPDEIFQQYGADAMRFYITNSPAVYANDLRFSKSGVEDVVKKILLPYWNSFYFLVTYANIDSFTPEANTNSNNPLDRWIMSEFNEFLKDSTSYIEDYDLFGFTNCFYSFLDNLTNWYVRRSRRRFWKRENDEDKIQAYNTLYYILKNFSKVIAPVCPFISEYIFRILNGGDSVHLQNYPQYDESLIDSKLNSDMQKTQEVISLGLSWRANNSIRVRQPLNSVTVFEDFDDYYKDIIKDELNVKNVYVVDNVSGYAKKICKPNARLLGPKYGKAVQDIIKNAKEGNFQELENGKVKVLDYVLESNEYDIDYESVGDDFQIQTGYGTLVVMDPEITYELKLEGLARDLIRQIQEARKEADYNVDDRINLSIDGKGIDEILDKFGDYLKNETLSTIVDNIDDPDKEKGFDFGDYNGSFKIKK